MRSRCQPQRVSGAGPAGLQHPVVPAGAAGVLHQACHAGYAETVVELPARLPALADLQQGSAQLEPVAQAHVGLGEAARAEVLAEGTRGFQQWQRPQFRTPGGVVVERVVVDSLVRPAVHAAVALLVAGQAELADRDRAVQRALVDRAHAARPGVGAGNAGQQRIHGYPHFAAGRHVSALSRYSASSACFGVSSSGSSAASASCTAEEGANRPIWRGDSSACGRMAPAWLSSPRASSSARRARASATTVFGSPASAATCRPKLRLAGPSLTACMNTSVSSPLLSVCSTASRCTLAMPLSGAASAVSSK